AEAAGAEHNGRGKTVALGADVTAREDVAQIVERAIAMFGGVGFLFNSAGAAMRRVKFLEIDDDLLDRTFALNLKGTFYGMQAVLPHMLERKFGVIVNVASMAARRGGARPPPPHASPQGAGGAMTPRGAARVP